MHWPELNIENVLLVAFAAAVLIQLWYYLGIYSRLAFGKMKETLAPGNLPPVSVIICAKNEDKNLEALLPGFLKQDYPEYEVIVVDDCSYDNTNDVLKEYAKKTPVMRFITIREEEQHPHGKKFAVMVGIKGAKYEHLLLTDADCRPAGDQWLRSMAGKFTEGKDIVLGYGSYERKKSLLNLFVRFDTFTIAMQYLSLALAGKPYMGVGRNLAYKKSLFFMHKGFASHYFIRSGDDDLFVNQVSTRENVSVNLEKDSITISRPPLTWKDWMRQKQRHMTTARYYRIKDKLRLGLIALSQYLFFSLFIILLILGTKPEMVLGAFTLRSVVQMIIFKKSTNRLNEQDLFLISPLLETGMMLFYPALAFSLLFMRKNKWMN